MQVVTAMPSADPKMLELGLIDDAALSVHTICTENLSLMLLRISRARCEFG